MTETSTAQYRVRERRSDRVPTEAAHEAHPTFPGSVVRHGTHSGWSKHTKDGERPCDPCFYAKQEYDKRRRETPEGEQRNRLRARAQARANAALARAHKAEYDALYRGFLAEIFGLADDA